MTRGHFTSAAAMVTRSPAFGCLLLAGQGPKTALAYRRFNRLRMNVGTSRSSVSTVR